MVATNNWEMIWIAAGIVLTTASKLRPAGLPLGPGEAILSVWILIASIRLWFSRSYLITPITRAIFLFWTASFVCLTMGLLIGEFSGIASANFYYDAIAFLLSFVFFILLSISIDLKKHLNRIILFVISFSIVPLAILFAFPQFTPFLNPWYGGIRFSGWSTNPNQVALLLSAVPFLALHLINQTNKNSLKIWYVLLIVGSLRIGISTESDALLLGWATGGILIMVFNIYTLAYKYLFVESANQSLTAINKVALFIFLTCIMLLVAVLFYGQLRADVSSSYDKGAQGSGRVKVWINGAEAIFRSPLFGVGPGSHSGLQAPFLDFESHNTFIDWGGSAGIIGLIAFFALLAWIGWNAWRSKSFIPLSALISLIAFCSFHYVLRHPIFWFYLVSLAGLSIERLPGRYPANRPISQTEKFIQNS
jgi:O-antigen ligase